MVEWLSTKTDGILTNVNLVRCNIRAENHVDLRAGNKSKVAYHTHQ